MIRHLEGRQAESGLDDGLTNADLCLIPKPGKPPHKPSNLICILRPDAKGLAGAARESLQPCVMTSLRDIPQFAYLPGCGLSDALDRVVAHLKKARAFLQNASPSRHALQQAGPRPRRWNHLRVDLSQAFDTLSGQEIISLLHSEGADGDTVRLVQALHDKSRYVLKAQGATTSVETTAGIKQGCKLSPTLFSFLTGQLFRSLVRQFGADQVLHFLTGYADDLTLHRTIRSVRDLRAIHRLTTSLLEEVKAHKLVVNQSKCVIIAKLAGEHHQQTLVLGNFCEGRESQRMATRSQQDLSCILVGSHQQISGGHDLLWPLRTPDSQLPHWGG